MSFAMFDTPITALFVLFFLALAFMFGGAIASFLGVVVERVPKGGNVNGVSKCACGRPLKWYENVPVFGWLRIGGTTKCCKTRLPVWYFLSELGAGILAASILYAILYTSIG